MKTVFVATVCFFITSLIQAQNNISIKLYVQDNLGRVDSVTFGLKDSSTIGIDVQYDEANIFGTLSDTLDVRVIQRDSLNFNCITDNPFGGQWSNSLYFPDNIDSKIDLRPFAFDVQSLNDNFEILISAQEYPVIVRADFDDLTWHWLEGWSSIHLLDSNCNPIVNESMGHWSSFDTLFTLIDSSYNTVIAHFEYEVGIAMLSKGIDLKIFPNPTKGTISIKSNVPNMQIVTVQNTLGQTVLRQQCEQKSSNISLNVQSLPTGIYFLTVGDYQGALASQKLLKTD